MLKKIARYFLNRLNYDVVPLAVKDQKPVVNHVPVVDVFKKDILEVYAKYRDFTMTSPERIYNVVESAKYISKYRVPGDIVECGVWKGGSMMAVATTLVALKDTSRKLYLYDTFHEGMSEPDERDESFKGDKAKEVLKNWEKSNSYPTKEDVLHNMLSTGYPKENIILVEGKVEDTIPLTLPEKISLLRLDTDWYTSTKHELEHLFPILSRGGILIIDDYGHWKGARQAADEYISEKKLQLFLNRIDYTGHSAIKL